MAIGLFVLFTQLGTLDLQELQRRAVAQWPVGSGVALAAAALLLGGAVGKSAQLPLQTWLPDAMAGPTPVSALIHAATMVNAGVYLIARNHALFELAPPVLFAVALLGTATLLLAGLSALAQRDIKRILAYSTMSQIGYMFLGLGVGAWSSGIYHLTAHASFKAGLFMGAGVVILALHHEQDVFRMGGLRRSLPVVFWTFLLAWIGPQFSKDLILEHVWASQHGHPLLLAVALAGAFVTALYLFRLIFIVFFGPERTHVSRPPGLAMQLPLVVLTAMALGAIFIELPALVGYHADSTGAAHEVHPPPWLPALGWAVTLAGILLAYRLFFARPEPAAAAGLRRLALEGFGFDRLYDALLVRPFVALARWGRSDFIDRPYTALAWLARLGYRGLHRTQTGELRLYAAGIAAGAIIVLALVVFL
jgi:NADH-quinone oxidoreductase subunit L